MVDYKILLAFSKVCEYMYRKGVYDAGMNGIIDDVKEVYDRNDGYRTFQMLGETIQNDKGWERYIDRMIFISNDLSAEEFRDFARRPNSRASLKREMAFFADAYYRKGLRHGLRKSRHDCIEFFENIGKGSSHKKFLTKGKYSGSQYIERMQSEANEIQQIRYENDFAKKYENDLTRFIRKAIKDYNRSK